jgi:hypothetical protein
MKLQKIKVGGIDVKKIAKNHSEYPEEVVAAAIEATKQIANQAYEIKKTLEFYLAKRLTDSNATKLPFINIDGVEMVVTLKSGKWDCKAKDVDEIYKKNGFDPIEIGKYVFKPSWTQAKEVRKLGGKKQELIDNFFKQDEPKIDIEEK